MRRSNKSGNYQPSGFRSWRLLVDRYRVQPNDVHRCRGTVTDSDLDLEVVLPAPPRTVAVSRVSVRLHFATLAHCHIPNMVAPYGLMGPIHTESNPFRGGSAGPRSQSPGPAKYIFIVLKSITALFFRRALSPRSPRRSLLATVGVVTVPVETV